jgi:hypothetical protein
LPVAAEHGHADEDDPAKTAALSLFIGPDKIHVMQNPPIQNARQNAERAEAERACPSHLYRIQSSNIPLPGVDWGDLQTAHNAERL